MIVTLKTEKLEVGMFVDLSASWFRNPFVEDRFVISSVGDIKRIENAGIKRVNIDSIRSTIPIKGLNDISIEELDRAINYHASEHTAEVEVGKNETIDDRGKKDLHPTKWKPETFIDPQIIEEFNNKSLQPNIRAKALYRYALDVMKRIFETPTKDIICVSKEGIEEIVEVIISDHKTALNLVNVVSLDSYTYTHSVNVGIKSLLLAKSLFGKSKKHNLKELGVAFFLHDIGKINIDQEIINKDGKLTDEEMEIIKTHPFEGYKVLSNLKLLTSETWVVSLHHHERENGSGYPSGAKGAEIHDYARICCIADVFDALTAKRSFKKQNTPIEALTIMKNEMLAHFDADLLKSFIMLFKNT